MEAHGSAAPDHDQPRLTSGGPAEAVWEPGTNRAECRIEAMSAAVRAICANV